MVRPLATRGDMITGGGWNSLPDEFEEDLGWGHAESWIPSLQAVPQRTVALMNQAWNPFPLFPGSVSPMKPSCSVLSSGKIMVDLKLDSPATEEVKVDAGTLAAIDLGIKAADEGRTIPLDDVRQMIPKWISKFKSQNQL